MEEYKAEVQIFNYREIQYEEGEGRDNRFHPWIGLRRSASRCDQAPNPSILCKELPTGSTLCSDHNNQGDDTHVNGQEAIGCSVMQCPACIGDQGGDRMMVNNQRICPFCNDAICNSQDGLITKAENVDTDGSKNLTEPLKICDVGLTRFRTSFNPKVTRRNMCSKGTAPGCLRGTLQAGCAQGYDKNDFFYANVRVHKFFEWVDGQNLDDTGYTNWNWCGNDPDREVVRTTSQIL